MPELGKNAELVAKMKKTTKIVYWFFFNQGYGSACHAFLEFNGLMSKYIDLCENADAVGIDFTQANVHNDIALPMESHDAGYLAEKLDCIFGPSLRANPEALEVFLGIMSGGLEEEEHER